MIVIELRHPLAGINARELRELDALQCALEALLRPSRQAEKTMQHLGIQAPSDARGGFDQHG